MISRTAKKLLDVLELNQTHQKTQPYDTPATVLKVEKDKLWVHIPGGTEKTPVKKTINAKEGDTVQVRVSGGSAWVTGNATSAPTDDTQANKGIEKAEDAGKQAAQALKDANIAHEAAKNAQQSANDASSSAETARLSAISAQDSSESASQSADTARQKAEQAIEDAGTAGRAASVAQAAAEAANGKIDDLQNYFWHDTNGAHVLGADNGYRNDMDSTGMKIVNTSTEKAIASFGVNGIILGEILNAIRTVIGATQISFQTDSGDVAYFGLNQEGIWEMHVDTMYADNMLRFGNYAWIKRQNGNMSLKWLGD